MKLLAVIFLTVLFATSMVDAQEPVEVFGYFETQMSGTQLDQQFYQMYYNKLRIDLKSNFVENVTFAANFDFITYHGKKEWNILDFLPARVTEEIPES
jgi:hypothetical protein